MQSRVSTPSQAWIYYEADETVCHSCSPNALYRWDIHTFSLTLYSVRDIAAGDQITIAYTDVLSPRAERTKRLRAAYKFACRCTSCRLLGKDGTQSDKRREFLREWLRRSDAPTFSAWYAQSEASPTAAIPTKDYFKGAGVIRKTLEEEHLEVINRDFMKLADSMSRAYGAVGKIDPFVRWTNIALVWWRVDAAWSERCKKRMATYERWLADPEKSARWNTRKEAEKKSQQQAPAPTGTKQKGRG